MPEGWGCALGGLPDLATENAEHMFIQHAPGIMLCVLVKGYVIQCAPGGPVRGDLRFFVWSRSVAVGLFPAPALLPAQLWLCMSSSASLSFRFFVMKWEEIAISLHMLKRRLSTSNEGSDLNTVLGTE